MCIRIIFTYVMTIMRNGLMGSKLLQPDIEIMVKTGFIVVDKDRSSNVHRIDQNQSLPDPALFETGFDLWGDIDQGSSSRYLKPQFFSITLHNPLLKHFLLTCKSVRSKSLS